VLIRERRDELRRTIQLICQTDTTRSMHLDWQEFCSLVRSLPEVAACDDAELHKMLFRVIAPSLRTDEFGRPLPGSSLMSEHPDLPNFRRVAEIRHQICNVAGDISGSKYFGRLVEFLKSHSELSRLQIVSLSTERECYEILYFPDVSEVLFSPVRYLEGRTIEQA
jgi:hypothetical protein